MWDVWRIAIVVYVALNQNAHAGWETKPRPVKWFLFVFSLYVLDAQR